MMLQPSLNRCAISCRYVDITVGSINIISCRQAPPAADAPEDVRVALGLAMRKAGPSWPVGVVLASVLHLPAAAPLGEQHAVGSSQDDSGDEQLVRRSVDRCRLLRAAVVAFSLEGAHEWKPLLDGKRLMEVTGARGRALGEMTAAVVRWQLANPRGTLEECEQWLKMRAE